ncbi:MAG: chemotaxis protein CheW [Pelagimonas sp.]|jgi:purine-binding chemotaxis protein CheW|nr:chemotaxis protein CheW [Pelagimonas sp.]
MDSTATVDTSGTLLVFRLADEVFGLPVGLVHEILDSAEPTMVPNASQFSFGLINVRGAVVPMTNIRLRLGLSDSPATETERDIVLQHEVGGVATKIAFKADAVESVYDINTDQIESIPALGTTWPQIYLKGAVRRGEQLIIVLEPDTLFHPEPHK